MNLDLIKRSVTSVTIAATLCFLALGLFINPSLLFLLAIPAPVIIYGALDTRRSRLPEIYSACCTNCGGEWTKWGSITRTSNYNSGDDLSTKYLQARTCKECGFAESRRVR